MRTERRSKCQWRESAWSVFPTREKPVSHAATPHTARTASLRLSIPPNPRAPTAGSRSRTSSRASTLRSSLSTSDPLSRRCPPSDRALPRERAGVPLFRQSNGPETGKTGNVPDVPGPVATDHDDAQDSDDVSCSTPAPREVVSTAETQVKQAIRREKYRARTLAGSLRGADPRRRYTNLLAPGQAVTLHRVSEQTLLSSVMNHPSFVICCKNH